MKEPVIMIVVSAMIALGAVAVLAWALITGQVREQGFDGLFLLVTCLLLAITFSLPLRRFLPPGAVRRLRSKIGRWSRSK